jgi:capsular polysaccharide biosynthesis protein
MRSSVIEPAILAFFPISPQYQGHLNLTVGDHEHGTNISTGPSAQLRTNMGATWPLR